MSLLYESINRKRFVDRFIDRFFKTNYNTYQSLIKGDFISSVMSSRFTKMCSGLHFGYNPPPSTLIIKALFTLPSF